MQHDAVWPYFNTFQAFAKPPVHGQSTTLRAKTLPARAGERPRTAAGIGHNMPMSAPSRSTTRLVWMDLEMTGLDPDADVILEIATIVTDASLDVVAEGPALAIHQPESALRRMDAWNTEHHTASGLLARVRDAAASLTEAEAATLAFVERHCAPRTAPLCGNSIWQDRRFLAKHMPTLNGYLHYRVVDVSTVKELARRWKPEVVADVKKRQTHRALADIQDSIAELRHYRERLFRL